jgi:hypothetical protein
MAVNGLDLCQGLTAAVLNHELAMCKRACAQLLIKLSWVG